MIAGSNSSSDFITTPKDKEVFVGESVQFDWEYIDSDVREVRFGLVMPPAKNSKEVAIYVKEKNGTLKFNHMDESIKWIRDRVQVVRNRRASFKINAVQLDDTRTFFCSLLVGENEISIRDTVELSVVGEYTTQFELIGVCYGRSCARTREILRTKARVSTPRLAAHLSRARTALLLSRTHRSCF